MSVYSSTEQLALMKKILNGFLRLPIATDTIPGAFMEAVIAHVHEGQRLPTYDYIDVLNRNKRLGWSIKSTKSSTPLTWKRAKISDKSNLILDSIKSEFGIQKLGDTIIEYCNKHAQDSMEKYHLDMIIYSRLILFPNNKIIYFERLLCSKSSPRIFNTSDFRWRWSTQKSGVVKEQLSALHGFHVPTGHRWWAWHGNGENQLHFTGERAWWPAEEDPHALTFTFPTADDKVSLVRLTELLEDL